MSTPVHLLQDLRLPSRYESLIAAVGVDVASLLVEPSAETLDIFRKAALHIKTRGRGLFLPLFAPSGTGKTTLISSLVTWIPSEYGPTARLAGGEVTADRLRQAAEALSQDHRLPANEDRVVVINIDDRESDPPSDKELSQIKSFVREPGFGSRTLVVWPETSHQTAKTMADAYENRAGRSPVPIPAEVVGPAQETWPDLAIATLKLVNALDNLQELGVDPRTYDPQEQDTVGDFLDQISADFVTLLDDLLRATRKPVRLIVAFASESGKAGILADLASGRRYGLLDADKLVSATPASVIGRWWKDRTGLLVQTIVRLDARTVFLAPSLAVPILRRYGPEDVVTSLDKMGITAKPPSDISTYFERSEFGRLLLGTDSPTAEIRGNPAHDAVAAFNLLSTDVGFGSGHDKKMNQAIGDFLSQVHTDLGDAVVEKKADGVPLIPDIAINAQDAVTCIELHWRSGDFLVNANRSSIAQYILAKLKAYALELGWVSAG